ncbi:MgtC/SapB family protein [Mesorhizobium sp. BAC0120]|uniref:MgtC/SapB family protein n=1 Tax=Mesorhizobium sp. BAC0120 TaxID=3090670 RepID=UPI00298C7548|nr:MgtC/SapB family protein [Mesorhizobium sp. BAC0120]MDW6021684.1 MgtC/SapB family protein [Mesorhizobium sp. BAC0120]
MQEFIGQIGPNTWLPFTAIAARMLLAAILGGIVGFEREWRKRPAGLRTHILVCLAAAVIAIITLELAHSSAFVAPLTRLDPVRTIEAVTSGVAFLATGFIVFARGHVIGITTGAGLWLAAAVGLACGFGYWQIGGLATLLAVTVLCVIRALEVRLEDKQPEQGADARHQREHTER